MQFALLSADDDTIQLAESLIEDGHEIIATYGCDSLSESLDKLAIARTQQFPIGDWERLQHEPDCSAAIVGRAADEEARAEHLRKLVQCGLPLVVVHPIADMLLSFELQMIQRDSKSPIVPYFPGIGAPLNLAIENCCKEAEMEAWGNIQQITVERAPRSESPNEVQEAFSRDAYLCRRWIGKVDRLSALGAKPYPSTDWRNLSVHMTAANGAIIRWTASPIPSTGEISIATDKGRFVCQNDFCNGDWRTIEEQSSVSIPHETLQNSGSDARLVCNALENFSRDSTTANQLWEDACRAIELSDTIDHSYRRGKTIEMYHEEHTEEETFKSMMAAGGCFAMLATLMIIPFFAMLESLQIPWLEGQAWHTFPLSLLYWRNWPYYLLGGLGVFLTLQFLRLVFQSDRTPDS